MWKSNLAEEITELFEEVQRDCVHTVELHLAVRATEQQLRKQRNNAAWYAKMMADPDLHRKRLEAKKRYAKEETARQKHIEAMRRYRQRHRKLKVVKGLVHGTNSGYTWHRCRCVLCKAAHNAANKAHRHSGKEQHLTC